MSDNDQPDWNTADPEVKQKAVYDLCALLDKDENNIRHECLTKIDVARETLKKVGNFKNMPPNLPVYVCEDNKEDRGKVMAIVLPAKGTLPPKFEDFDIKSACPCTWTPYRELMIESLQPGDSVTIQIRRGR